MLEKSDKAFECLKMGKCPPIEEAATLLRQVAGERQADESVKGVLRRLGHKLKGKRWTASRIRSVWYRDRRVSVRSEEIEELRAMTRKREEDKAAADELAENREIRERLALLEQRLATIDPSFHSPSLAATRHQIELLGGTSGAKD